MLMTAINIDCLNYQMERAYGLVAIFTISLEEHMRVFCGNQNI